MCPVCAETVRGDQGVLEAHVDTCVATEGMRLEERQQMELAQMRMDEEHWGVDEDRGNYVGDLAGMCFKAS